MLIALKENPAASWDFDYLWDFDCGYVE